MKMRETMSGCGSGWLGVRGEYRLVVALGCIWLLAASTPLFSQSLVNVALHRSFTTNGSPYGNWRGLVDGVMDSDRAPYCFATDGVKRLPKWVVIDLGASCRVSKVKVLNSYNGNVRTVGIYWSMDGQKFEILREYIFPQDRLQTLSHSFPPREVRFVKIAFADTHGGGYGGDYYMFLREVEVWGEPGTMGPPAKVDVRPQPDTAPRWLRIFRHYAVRSGTDLKLVVLGDSVGVPAPSADDVRPFGQLLADLLAEQRSVADETGAAQLYLTDLSADRQGVQECIARLEEDVLAQEPDIVVVALGLWDLLSTDRKGFRDRLNGLVARLLGRTHAAIILVTPPPILADEGKPFYRETQGRSCTAAAQAVQAIGELNGLPVVNLAEAFKETELDRSQLYDDNLHLSSLGHTTVAQRIFNLLK